MTFHEMRSVLLLCSYSYVVHFVVFLWDFYYIFAIPHRGTIRGLGEKRSSTLQLDYVLRHNVMIYERDDFRSPSKETKKPKVRSKILAYSRVPNSGEG